MEKRLALLIASIYFVCHDNLFAQYLCAADELKEEYRINDPEYNDKQLQFNHLIKMHITENLSGQGLNPLFPSQYVIPIIIHVIHDQNDGVGVGTNITYAQIESQINGLNAAFAKQYPSYNGQNHEIYSVNTEIQFCLAKTSFVIGCSNPVEPGVVRHPIDVNTQTSLYNVTSDMNGLNNLYNFTHGVNNCFPIANYLNIWIVNSIANNGVSYVGISTLGGSPGVGSSGNFDGIVMRADGFGDNSGPWAPFTPATLNPLWDDGKYFVHEVGHYLGLQHIFNGNCTGMNDQFSVTDQCDIYGDYICDIVPCTTQFWNCSVSVLPNTCTENYTPANGIIDDMVMDYMSYSLDVCMNTFTNDQKNRMWSILNLFRGNLWTNLNLALTGVYGNAIDNCLPAYPLGDIIPSTTILCAPNNNTLTLENPMGSFSSVVLWTWLHPGATLISNSPSNILTIQYPSPGSYTVTLTITDQNSQTYTTTHSVFVSSCSLVNNIEQGNWCFGGNVNLSFSSGFAVSSSTMSSINTFSSAASVSNLNTGDLLFYTDGINVWNKNHVIFNGTMNGVPNSSMTKTKQGTIIVEDPGNTINSTRKYYIFVTPDPPSSSIYKSLEYSIIDMDLNLGLGDFHVLNQSMPASLISPNITGGLTAIPHCNGEDYWIIVHGGSGTYSDKILSYLLTKSGIVLCTLSNSFNVSHNSGSGNEWGHQILFEASPNGNFVCVSHPVGGLIYKFELYSFNSATGELTHNSTFESLANGNGYISFSPNSQYIYYYYGFGNMMQADIANPFIPTVAGYSLGSTIMLSQPIQLASDGRIYFGKYLESELGVINTPDNTIAGNACGATYQGVSLQSGQIQTQSFPNMIDALKPSISFPTFSSNLQSNCSTVIFEIDNCWSIYNVSWDFGDGYIGSGSSVSHTYLNSGTYTVTLTLSIGSYTLPSITQQIGVIASTSLSIYGPASCCITPILPPNYSTTYIPGANYSWSANGGTALPNGHLCDVNWSTVGVGSLSVTVDLNGCTVSTQYIININECCEIANTASYLDPVYNGTSISNQTLIINGSAVLNGNNHFEDCTIYMGPNAEISYSSGASLTLNNTHILGCDKMWKGIDMSAIGSELNTTNGSIIEDAENAVYAPSNRFIIIENTHFDHNYVALNLQNGAFASFTLQGNNTFNCTGGYSLKAPRLAERSFSHILLSNATDIVIGGNFQGTNIFAGAIVGIYARGSFYEVYNCNFSNFLPQMLMGYAHGGIAISNNDGSSAIIGDNTSSVRNIFSNCFYGISSSYGNELRILNNEFTNCFIAATSFIHTGPTIEIVNNDMTGVNHGIYFFLNGRANIFVEENRVTVNQNTVTTYTSGMEILDWGITSPVLYLRRNVIHNSGDYGILVGGVFNAMIDNNHVYMEQAISSGRPFFGLFIRGAYKNSTVSCNLVETDISMFPKTGKYGFYFYDFQSSFIDGNTAYGNQFGIVMEGNCGVSEIKGNYFTENEKAFVLGNPVSGSGQPASTVMNMNLYSNELPGNLWDLNTNVDATHTYFNNAPVYWCLNNQGNTDFPFPNSTTGGTAINPSQFVYNLYNPPICNVPMSPPVGGGEHSLMIGFNEQILASQIPTINSHFVTEWKAKQKLYEELRTDSTLLDSSLAFQNFYVDESGENIGFLTEVKEAFEIILSAIKEQDSILAQNFILEAVLKNNVVIPEIMPELNEQLVNDVFITQLSEKRIIVNSSEESVLLFVASQCVYEGGPSVEFARLLLHVKYPWMYFSDFDYCNGTNNYRTGIQSMPNSKNISRQTLIYPVPASDKIYFKLPSLEESRTIEIFDITGRNITSFKPTGIISTFDINGLEPGSYKYRILLNLIPDEHGRFEVIK